MSNPNPQSGNKRKRSSEHSGRELDFQHESSVKASESRFLKELTVPPQPAAQLQAPTTNQEPKQVSRVQAWITDSQEKPPVGDQESALSAIDTDLDSRRLSLSSAATSITAPLTKENLKLLRQQTMPANSGKAKAPSTPSKSTTKPSNYSNDNTFPGAHELLAINGMHIESVYDLELFPQIRQETDRLLVDRESERKRDTGNIVTAIRQFGLSNENTLCAKIMPLLQGTERSVEQQVREGETKTVLRAWSIDALGENWNVQFEAGALPTLVPGTEIERDVYEELLEIIPRLKNPKPDIVYGPFAGAFSREEQAVNKKFLTFSSCSRPVFHPAFIWEWKAAKGCIEEATIQACRAAAAVGYAIREFRRRLGLDPDENMADGIDLKSLVYAMCIDNRNAYMHACFYAKDGDSVIFRMIQVRQYPLADSRSLSNLRGDVHNILDWTVGERLNWIKRIIGEYLDREGHKPVASRTGQAASSSGSPAKKKMRTQHTRRESSDGDELA